MLAMIASRDRETALSGCWASRRPPFGAGSTGRGDRSAYPIRFLGTFSLQAHLGADEIGIGTRACGRTRWHRTSAFRTIAEEEVTNGRGS
jgi:hypothetical protein